MAILSPYHWHPSCNFSLFISLMPAAIHIELLKEFPSCSFWDHINIKIAVFFLLMKCQCKQTFYYFFFFFFLSQKLLLSLFGSSCWNLSSFLISGLCVCTYVSSFNEFELCGMLSKLQFDFILCRKNSDEPQITACNDRWLYHILISWKCPNSSVVLWILVSHLS